MSDRHFQERVPIKDGTPGNNTVIATINRLLFAVEANGGNPTSGDIRIRKYYDHNYLRDEILITWDQVDD